MRLSAIKGFEGLYVVSDDGRIFSCRTRELKISKNQGGYSFIVLLNKGKKINFRLHRLVAESFIENPLNKAQVNHKDGNKNNNHYKNLEWVSLQENLQHYYKNTPRRLKKECLTCNKVFYTYLSRVKNGLGKYCSKKCIRKNSNNFNSE